MGKEIFFKLTTALICMLGAMQLSYAVDAEDQYFVNDPDADKYALILVGASFSEQGEQEFRLWATQLYDALLGNYGYEKSNVYLLLGDKPENFEGSANRGRCRAENIEKVLKQISRSAQQQDQLTVFLFGHGSGYREQAKYNIVGPDITGTQFASMLKPVKVRNMVIVNTTSASYDFARELTSPGRVVLSATRSAAEKYDTRFPRYFVEGIRNHRADRDKNQRLSMLEVFNFAKEKVDTFFSETGRLATEHGVLDDNADGVFSLEPGAEQGDGRLAEIAYLDAGITGTQSLSARAAAMRVEMDKLERSVFLLRNQKTSLSEDEYWQRMEPLLIDLAKVSSDFREAQNASE